MKTKKNYSVRELKEVMEKIGGLRASAYEDRDDVDVKCDFENIELIGYYTMPGTEGMDAFEVIDDVPVCWCAAGGDWEDPVAFCMYLDGKGKLRGFVPIEGNAFCKEENCAYGSESEDEQKYYDKSTMYVFDPKKMRNEFAKKIA